MSRALPAGTDLERKLTQLARRPDLPLTMKIRTRLLKLIDKDLDWLWDQYKANVMYADKGGDSRAKLLTKIIDKILVEQRDQTSGDVPVAPAPPMSITINGVQRGTRESLEAVTVTVERDGRTEQAVITDG